MNPSDDEITDVESPVEAEPPVDTDDDGLTARQQLFRLGAAAAVVSAALAVTASVLARAERLTAHARSAEYRGGETE